MNNRLKGSAIIGSIIMISISIICLLTLVCPAFSKEGKSASTAARSVASGNSIIDRSIDLIVYASIRQEGFKHSHVMEYSSGLDDGIGARLMGSPNMTKAYSWSIAQLEALGMFNPHLEDIGEFGVGWVQTNTWVRMASPDHMTFVTQAVPWSASSHGIIHGRAIWVDINSPNDFNRYRGKLNGKIVFLGAMRDVPQPVKPWSDRYTEVQLAAQKPRITEWSHVAKWIRKNEFEHKLAQFLESEHIAAVVVPSRDGANGGGTGILFDDNEVAFGSKSWRPENAKSFPEVIVAIEDYGRVYRLLQRGTPVSIEMNVDTTITGNHVRGYNVVADIPGTDPQLKAQMVILGAHLDSWGSGTGATDDGAGVAVSLEALRILKAINVRPRRTIRVVLYGGEEEGLLGSSSYVRKYLGSYPLSTDPDQQYVPYDIYRKPAGPLTLKPGQHLVSAAYNFDVGSGKIRGIFTEGNSALVPIFKQWIAPLKDIGVTEVADMPDWPADQWSYDAVGVPGLMFLQDPLDYFSRTHHSNMDTYERLSPEDLKQAAVVEAIFIYNTAMRDHMLPRLPVPIVDGKPATLDSHPAE